MARMKTLDELTQEIFNECAKDGEPVTMEQAREMAQMEIGAKDSIPNAKSIAPKKPRKPKTTKVSDEKATLFKTIVDSLGGNAEIITENKLIRVKIGDLSFKIDVIQERNSKNPDNFGIYLRCRYVCGRKHNVFSIICTFCTNFEWISALYLCIIIS